MTTKVLIFSRDATWFGGVVNFIELLKQNLGPDIEASQFLIGRRKGSTGVILRPLVPILDLVRLAYTLVKNRYDVFHLNPSLNGSSLVRDGLFLRVIYLLSSGRVLICFHGWEDNAEKFLENSRFACWLFRKTFGRADRILVLAQPFKDWLVKMGIPEQKIELYTTMFDGRSIPRLELSHLGEDDNLNILFLSRIVIEKGVFELLEAFRRILDQHPNTLLTIAGTGPEEGKMKAWVSTHGLTDKVTFLGYVREDGKARALASAHIFAFPTFYGEGCPVSLLEAMAAGLAVVTTPVGGIPDIIDDPENGVLIEKRVTADSVEAALRHLLSNRGRLRDIGLRNQDKAWARYDAPTVTGKFEHIYQLLERA